MSTVINKSLLTLVKEYALISLGIVSYALGRRKIVHPKA